MDDRRFQAHPIEEDRTSPAYDVVKGVLGALVVWGLLVLIFSSFGGLPPAT